MEEKELIAKISLLKDIKPQDEWVVLNRQRLFPLQAKRTWGILDQFAFFLKYLEKPAFVMPVLAIVVAGGIGWNLSTQSLPGDALYSLKSAVERVPLNLSSKEERPFLQLELAQRRLDDLKKIAESDNTGNLPSAIQEFESNVFAASKGFAEIVENQPDKALQASREVVQLQRDTREIEKILGVVIGKEETEEFEDTTRILVENEIQHLEDRTLTEPQQELFNEAKIAAENQDYPSALEKIWMLSNIQVE